MTERLARVSSRHPWRVIAAWVVAVVASVLLIGMFLEDALTADIEITSETESKRGDEILFQGFPEDRAAQEKDITEVVVVRAVGGSIEDPVAKERLRAFAAELRAVGATNVIVSGANEEFVSQDGDTRAVPVGLGFDAEENVPAAVDVVQRLDDEPNYEAAMTGEWTTEVDFSTLSQDDLREGELFFGAPTALVILLLVFGAVVAGLVPLLFAIISIIVALALVAVLGTAYDLSVFTINMLTGMGLALGIDYTLFILSRYREERSQRRERLDAIATAGATASRAVLFSGMAFVLAMFGLVLVPSTIFRSLAAGAILVGVVSVVAALTLLPAVLGLLGDRVNAVRIPFFGRVAAQAGKEGRFWGAIVHAVMRRPVLSLVLAAGFLIALSLPVLGLETGTPGRSTMPDRFESKQGYVLLNDEFPGQTTDPVEIALAGDIFSPGVAESLQRLRTELAKRPIFGGASVETNDTRRVARVTVPIAGDPVGDRAIDAVRDLREDIVPQAFAGADVNVFVTGETAYELDYHETVDWWRVPVFIFVLGLSFILLTIAFRSIVVPLKAIVLNLLSVGAAYGLLVLVFQKGYGNELLGLEEAETVAAWVPLFLFSVLFGLSMDYQVFLLSRIRERYRRTGDNTDAVAYGVGSTARLITGAALIIIAVFWGFAMGDLIMFQQMGFGVAVALLLDATIVRSVLVPASMKLLGKWNWYLPSWLSWLPDAHVEGVEPAPARPSPATGSS